MLSFPRFYAYSAAALLLCGLTACDNDDGDEGRFELEQDAILGVKTYINSQLQTLVKASKALQAAAPEPDADGWNVKDDADAVEKMRAAWSDTRDAYERIEGSIAILFDGLDVSTDQRYDAFIEDEPDRDLFDGEGVTGMHGIERILWSGVHPAAVIEFESALPGYEEAAFPQSEAESEAFKTELAQRLVDDVQTMHDEFKPFRLGSSTAFGGVIGSMGEQLEKVTLATTAEDESRYAQRTLDDMRANLDGGVAVYKAFSPWVQADAGDDVDTKIRDGFDKIETAYSVIKGPAIPPAPAKFDTEDPSEEDLATPYGKLWTLLTEETDPNDKSSLISLMAQAAGEMEIPIDE